MINRIKNTIAQLGLLDGLLYIAAQALSKLSAGRIRLVRYYLVAQPVPTDVEATIRPSDKNTVALALPGDPLVAVFPRPPEVISKRFQDGHQCFVARSGTDFSGFLWLARNAYDEDEVRCRYELGLPAESSWDFDVYVEPRFRIGRTFARLWQTANQHLAGEGVKWSFSRISGFNPGSLLAHGRLGIHRLFSATFVCIGPVQITVVGASPYFHCAFSTGSRPTLRLIPPAS